MWSSTVNRESANIATLLLHSSAINVNDAPIQKESTDFQLLANNASKNVPLIVKKTTKKYVDIRHLIGYDSSSNFNVRSFR